MVEGILSTLQNHLKTKNLNNVSADTLWNDEGFVQKIANKNIETLFLNSKFKALLKDAIESAIEVKLQEQSKNSQSMLGIIKIQEKNSNYNYDVGPTNYCRWPDFELLSG